MKAALALFANHKGEKELRLYFPTWEVDGRTLKGINVLPHRCDPSVCEYGDHVHVGVYDDPIRIICEDHVTLTDEQSAAITNYLRAQVAVDRMIYDFEGFLKQSNQTA
ncbi:MAG TPA: hypothetical protein VHZ04_03450 [Candidatus Paceibacterota bacterium]|jgi:hypothetical protein|nr:hypothetical protein [Candidatus Paceibacterota bacterium]